VQVVVVAMEAVVGVLGEATHGAGPGSEAWPLPTWVELAGLYGLGLLLLATGMALRYLPDDE
jgi:hypothetical protein